MSESQVQRRLVKSPPELWAELSDGEALARRLGHFGEIRITYVPDAHCIELKALKYYLIGFRDRGIFYEHATNQILDDLVAALHPRRMRVVGDFSVRGGIKTVVTAEYTRS